MTHRLALAGSSRAVIVTFGPDFAPWRIACSEVMAMRRAGMFVATVILGTIVANLCFHLILFLRESSVESLASLTLPDLWAFFFVMVLPAAAAGMGLRAASPWTPPGQAGFTIGILLPLLYVLLLFAYVNPSGRGVWESVRYAGIDLVMFLLPFGVGTAVACHLMDRWESRRTRQ